MAFGQTTKGGTYTVPRGQESKLPFQTSYGGMLGPVAGQGGWGAKPVVATPAPVARAAPVAAPAPAAVSGPNYNDISGLFREALANLSGDTEKMYQQGKRRTLADIAMQSVNAGMANTLNLPAADIAYDEANRAQTNLALGTQKAGILTGLGQTAAGIYGTNVGAQTQRYGIDVGAASDAASRALQQYIAQLSSDTSLEEASMRYNQPSGGGGGGTSIYLNPGPMV